MFEGYPLEVQNILGNALQRIGEVLTRANAELKKWAEDEGDPTKADDYLTIGATFYYNDPNTRCESRYETIILPPTVEFDSVELVEIATSYEITVYGEPEVRTLQYSYLATSTCKCSNLGDCCRRDYACKTAGYPGVACSSSLSYYCGKYYPC